MFSSLLKVNTKKFVKSQSSLSLVEHVISVSQENFEQEFCAIGEMNGFKTVWKALYGYSITDWIGVIRVKFIDVQD